MFLFLRFDSKKFFSLPKAFVPRLWNYASTRPCLPKAKDKHWCSAQLFQVKFNSWLWVRILSVKFKHLYGFGTVIKIPLYFSDFLKDYLFLTIGILGSASSDVTQNFAEVSIAYSFTIRYRISIGVSLRQQKVFEIADSHEPVVCSGVLDLATDVLYVCRWKDFKDYPTVRVSILGHPRAVGRAVELISNLQLW